MNTSIARTALALLTLVLATALAACGGDVSSSTAETTASTGGGCADVQAPAPKKESFKQPEQVLKKGEPATAKVETSCGDFTITLDTKDSPKTANSFAFLAEKGFYDGTIFH